MTLPDSVELKDGSAHGMPCPAERHEGDGEAPMLSVQFLAADEVWLLRCWGRPDCAYGEIATLLGIDPRPDWEHNGNRTRDIVAAYDDVDPDKRPRLVFQSGRDGEGASSGEKPVGRPPRYRGGEKDSQLLLWVPEDSMWSGHKLVVVHSEEAAMALMRAGVYRDGYVPVTWHRGVWRNERGHHTADLVDWSRVRNRETVFWPANTSNSYKEMFRAAIEMAAAAGAARLLMAHPSGMGLTEGADALSLADGDAIMAVLSHVTELPMPGTVSQAPPGMPEGQPTMVEPVEPGETTTDIGMVIQVLREHGHRMVLATRPYGSAPHVEVYWRGDTGLLERRPEEFGVRLWESRTRYLQEARDACNRGEITKDDFQSCVRDAKRMGSADGLRAVADSLLVAYRVLERDDAVPDGLELVDQADIDADGRFLGAPDGIVDLSSGRLLSISEARHTLVSRTIPDPFDPEARDPDVDTLLAHLGEEDRERLLNAVAYALKGLPSDRMYIFDGGRSRDVLLTALRSALGPGYAGGVPHGVLLDAGGGERIGGDVASLARFVGPRILVGSVQGRTGRLSPGLIADLTLSDGIRARTVHDDIGSDTEPTATMSVALDAESLAGFGAEDRPLLTRLRLLRYPDAPAIDSTFGDRAIRRRTFRQALLALLVRRSAAMSAPPDDIPHLVTPQELSHLGSFEVLVTAADRWLREAMEVTGKREDRTSSTALWDAAHSDLGSGSDPDLAWGMSRRSLTTRAIEIHGLRGPQSVRIDGAVFNGWTGVRLLAGAGNADTG